MSCRPVCALLILSLTGLTYSTGIVGRRKREAIHSLAMFSFTTVASLKDRRVSGTIFPLSCILSWHFLLFVFLGLAAVRKHMSSRGAFPVCTCLPLESKHRFLTTFQWRGCFSSLRSHPSFIYELTSSEIKISSVWMSHFVLMCKSIVLFICVRRVTVKALFRAMEVHLTNHSPLLALRRPGGRNPLGRGRKKYLSPTFNYTQ